jgi:uncharacterized protein
LITQREISQKAYRENKQDRVIEKDYVLNWVLLGIAHSPFGDCLAFKGGTALKKLYYEDYRYSEDLDFTMLEKTNGEELPDRVSSVLNDLEDETAIPLRINESKMEQRANSLTMYVDFIGPLQGAMGSRDIKVDFTLNETLAFELGRRQIFTPYSDCAGLNRTIRAYSLEKLCAIITRTEPRDLFDLHFLLSSAHIDDLLIPEGFKAKANSKSIDPDRLAAVLLEREGTISRLWETRLALQVDQLLPFKQVMRETRQALRRIGLS